MIITMLSFIYEFGSLSSINFFPSVCGWVRLWQPLKRVEAPSLGMVKIDLVKSRFKMFWKNHISYSLPRCKLLSGKTILLIKRRTLKEHKSIWGTCRSWCSSCKWPNQITMGMGPALRIYDKCCAPWWENNVGTFLCDSWSFELPSFRRGWRHGTGHADEVMAEELTNGAQHLAVNYRKWHGDSC